MTVKPSHFLLPLILWGFFVCLFVFLQNASFLFSPTLSFQKSGANQIDCWMVIFCIFSTVGYSVSLSFKLPEGRGSVFSFFCVSLQLYWGFFIHCLMDWQPALPPLFSYLCLLILDIIIIMPLERIRRGWVEMKMLALLHAKSFQSCPILCNPMDYRLPGSSVHGILQARMLEWVAISFSRGFSGPRNRTPISCIGR